jgi:hypothetical protein
MLIVLNEVGDKPIISKTVIGVLADDHVVEHLDHEELGRPNKISGQFSVFTRRRRIAGGVVVNENQSCGLVLKCQGHNLPGVDSASRERALEYVLIHDEFIFPVEKQNPEDLSLQVSHGVKQIVENRL